MITWLWNQPGIPKWLRISLTLFFVFGLVALVWFVLYPYLGQLVLELQNGLVEEQ